jgi:hypothetical protein
MRYFIMKRVTCLKVLSGKVFSVEIEDRPKCVYCGGY